MRKLVFILVTVLFVPLLGTLVFSVTAGADTYPLALPKLSADIRTYTGGSNYNSLFSGPGTTTQWTWNGVLFRLAQDSSGNTVYNTYGTSLTIPANVYRATHAYTLINSAWGTGGVAVGKVEFYGSGGGYYEVDLVEGTNVRDHYNGTWENNIDGVTAVNAFTSQDGMDRLDMQIYNLPSSFATQTLTNVVFTTFTQGNGGQPFIAAATVVGNPAPVPAVIEGSVVCSDSPVANAIVTLSMANTPQRTATTDSSGKFAFQVPVANRRASAHIATVSNLCKGNTVTVTIRPGVQLQPVTIKLQPKPSSDIATVSGTLTDSNTGQGIPGAAVEILGAGDVLSATTDSDGKFTIAGVGFNANLQLQATTKDPPCIEPVIQRLPVKKSTVIANISAPRLRIPAVHCPVSFIPAEYLIVTAKSSGLPKDNSLNWGQADGAAILMDSNADAWNAGHVNDILVLDSGNILVAGNNGGVWIIPEGGVALPLSDTWESTSMMTLAAGPDGAHHVYAGTQSFEASAGGELWETDTSQQEPLNSWQQVDKQPPCGLISKILVIPEKRRIVLACDTGLYWSNIPAKPNVSGKYDWKDATPAGTVNGKDFSGLAKGPGWQSGAEGTIVASRWGGQAPSGAIYYGSWSGGNLQLQSSLLGTGFSNPSVDLGRISIASCSSDPSQMYAVAADPKTGEMLPVLQSIDGGGHWLWWILPSPDPGKQGDYNNVIAVSPDCKTVAVGWQAGTFVSYDKGSTWNLLSDPVGHLHADVHGLTFDPTDGDLYIGSDGGVASVHGLGPTLKQTFVSNWNRNLFTMEIYHADGLGVADSSAATGIVAAGTQDNGVVWAGLPGPWKHVTDCGCDGRWARFLTPILMETGNGILLAEEWGVPDWPFDYVDVVGGNIPYNAQTVIPVSTSNPANFTNTITEIVKSPERGFMNAAGLNLYAVGAPVGASDPGNQVYGLFGDDYGTQIHWEPLGEIGGGQKIHAVSPSLDGTSWLAGTEDGNIYRLDAPYTGTAMNLTVNTPSGVSGSGPVTGFAMGSTVYATVNYNGFGNGFVMKWDGNSWNSVGAKLPHNLAFYSIVARTNADGNDDIYVATNAGVYDSHDGGQTWNQACSGLPNITPRAELRLVGGYLLYLSTYGRSLFRAQLP